MDAALRAGGKSVQGLEPAVSCTGLSGDGTTFALHFTASSNETIGATRPEMLPRVYRHLRLASMHPATPGQPAPTAPAGVSVPAHAGASPPPSDPEGLLPEERPALVWREYERMT